MPSDILLSESAGKGGHLVKLKVLSRRALACFLSVMLCVSMLLLSESAGKGGHLVPAAFGPLPDRTCVPFASFHHPVVFAIIRKGTLSLLITAIITRSALDISKLPETAGRKATGG